METASIKEQIRKLIELQGFDSKIYAFRNQLIEKPKEIEGLKRSFDEKKQALLNAEEDLKKAQLRRKEKEGELATKEENIKKLQAQLYQLKTNKEYQVMLTEIAGHKADNSLLEEDILKVMDEMDSLNKGIQNEKLKLSQEEIRFNQEKKVIEEQITQINEELKQLEFKRSQITPMVEARLLMQYERILKNKEGLALVPVQNGTCHGCFTRMPPQVENQIRMNDTIVICGACNRILYVEDDVG